MIRLLYPPKCVLCRQLLAGNETDFCHDCRKNTPTFTRAKRNIPFVAHWTALWYYKDDVRKSIHRFKFGRRYQLYARVYARPLALKLEESFGVEFDAITWVPVSALRRLRRGFDQSQLLTQALCRELDRKPTRLLKKIRHTPPQSGIREAAKRRANVLGAYRAIVPELIRGKRILLLDDVVTTGATVSECARTLLTAGAKEVYFAAIAAAEEYKK